MHSLPFIYEQVHKTRVVYTKMVPCIIYAIYIHVGYKIWYILNTKTVITLVILGIFSKGKVENDGTVEPFYNL